MGGTTVKLEKMNGDWRRITVVKRKWEGICLIRIDWKTLKRAVCWNVQDMRENSHKVKILPGKNNNNKKLTTNNIDNDNNHTYSEKKKTNLAGRKTKD